MAFQGSLNELPLPDIIQLVSVSGKTGMFDLRNGVEDGQIFLRDGQIVHAKTRNLEGEEAVYELAIWPQGDFVFTQGCESSVTSIQKSNTNLLMEAARRIDEWQILSKKIPSTRLVPVFKDQSVNTSVSFTPQEWSIVCKVDERRTIEEIAAAISMSPFETSKHLYGLVASGLLDLREDYGRKLRALNQEQLRTVAAHLYRSAQQLLADHQKRADLDQAAKQCQDEMEAGRSVDAVLELLRSHEQTVGAALGPNQSRTLVDELSKLLSRIAS